MLKRNLLLLLLFTLNKVAFAQLPEFDYSNPKQFTIAEVNITGVKYLNNNIILKLTGLEVGQKINVPGEEITQALKKLWEQNMFFDVKIGAIKVVDDQIYLEISLLERARLSQVIYQGIKKSHIKEIEERLKIVRGSLVTEHLISNIKRGISEYYIEKGYLNVETKFRQIDDTTLTNSVFLIFDIDRKKRVKINDIVVKGNNILTENKVRRSMKETKRRRWWRIFKSSKFIEKNYKDDKLKIIEKYHEKGYRDAKIVTDTVYPLNEKRVNIEITIDEGRQYFFRNITWVGNTKYLSKQLTSVLGIKKGDVFDQTVLDKRLTYDQDAVGSLYLDDGYLFFNITPVEKNIASDSVDLELRIYEGPQADIKNVSIVGNTRTNEHVIRREIRTKPGELFRKSDVIRSVRELAQLNYFDAEQIVPTPIPNQADGTVDMEYSVIEKATDQIEVSGGWGADMVIGTVALKFNNFSTRNFFNKDAWRPLPSGDGQQLSLAVRSNGQYYQMYSVSFVEPWLGGKSPTSLSVSVFHSRQTNGYTGDSRRAMLISGGSVGIGRRLAWPDDYFILQNSISYQNYDLTNWNYFIFNNGTANNLSLTTTFSRNSVDNPLYSRNGSLFQLSLQLTPPYSLFQNKDYTQLRADNNLQDIYEWIEYHKWTFKAKWFQTIIGDLVVHAKAYFGYLGYYNDKLGASPFEGYYVGGDGMSGYNLYGIENIALRGYEYKALTPSSMASLYNKFAFEVRHPITLNPSASIYVLTFLEAGNAANNFESYNPFKVYRSAGIGARIFLPMIGLIGFDWGYGFDDTGNAGRNKTPFHFMLGYEID